MASYKQHRHGSRPVESLMWRGHPVRRPGLDGAGRAFLLAALDVDSHEGRLSIRATKCKNLGFSPEDRHQCSADTPVREVLLLAIQGIPP